MALRSEERRQREYEDGRYDEFGEFMPGYAPGYVANEARVHGDASGTAAFIRSLGGVLTLLLAVRFGISLYTSDVSAAVVATIYTLTNWLVAPFNTLLGIIPTGTSGFVDWPAVAAIGFVVVITTIVSWLIHSLSHDA